ncbi:MAG: Fur family transcriptional regulator [Bacillota bacterium]|nr:Fur family transcriptional regulator [Bacillota bacterium]
MKRRGLREAEQRLADADYRLTPQRALILRLLFEHQGEHLSAEELHALVGRTNPEVGLATVYRTLELLTELRVLQAVDLGDGRARYELAGEDRHSHHHLLCLSCGRVEEVRDDLLERLEQSVEAEHGFAILDHQVKFVGLCRECRTRERWKDDPERGEGEGPGG